MVAKLVEDILAVPDEQTVVVPGIGAAETVPIRLSGSLKSVLMRGKTVASEAGNILDAHPLVQILTWTPGIEVKTSARILPQDRRRLGSSIRGEHPTRTS